MDISNFFEGKVSAITDVHGFITLADGIDEHGCISLRLEQIRMSRTQSKGALQAIIQNRTFLGEHAEYLVRHHRLGGIIVLVPRQYDAALNAISKGETVWI